MIHEEVFLKVRSDEQNNSGAGLHTFIAHFMEEGKSELFKKLGFNYRKFKKSGEVLFVTSLEIDFNYPVNCTDELYMKIELLDVYGSRIRIQSMIYNKNGSLVATANSTFIRSNTNKANSDSNLYEYFDFISKGLEEVASY